MDYSDKISNVVKMVPPSAIRRFFDLANEMKGEGTLEKQASIRSLTVVPIIRRTRATSNLVRR